jgi:hypothetical protein
LVRTDRAHILGHRQKYPMPWLVSHWGEGLDMQPRLWVLVQIALGSFTNQCLMEAKTFMVL